MNQSRHNQLRDIRQELNDIYERLDILCDEEQEACMLTKEITPIIAPVENKVVGVLVEYKLFRILLYRKRMYTPSHYGLTDWEFDYRI